MHNEFDFLTQETFNLNTQDEILADDDFRNEFLFGHSSEQINKEVQKQDYPQTCGLVFNIVKSSSTFSLRGVITDNISDTFEAALIGDTATLKALRIDQDEVSKSLYYEVDNLDLAQVIFDQVFNKRFPLEEDLICNISDPGFSWWYQRSDDAIRINFKSHKLEGNGQRLKLGPIGDVCIASILFSRLEKYLESKMSFLEYNVSEKHFIIKPKDRFHRVFDELSALFEEGELDRDAHILKGLDGTLNLYLKELATIRKFWLRVESLNTDQGFNLLS
ncbi:hypothetical protein [Halobacteriovorax sp. YZS-1-1]|uniref:hypothetical protein n=1 Tax=unclassified Halobacteriovorax TaxID=2639665 RepID=UPI00399BEDE6